MSEALRHINAYVCGLCLTSVGAECHVPGCMFWLHDVPTEDTADALRSAVEVTTHNDPSEDDAREVLAARLRMLCEDAEDRRDWVRVADLRAMLGTS